MNDEAAFLTAIAADPKDELGYLVFADWLQEQGEEARAGLVRDPRTRAALGPMLIDPSHELRECLLHGIDTDRTFARVRAMGADAIPMLADMLERELSNHLSLEVLGFIDEIGAPARVLAPKLLPILMTESHGVQRAASRTIARFDPPHKIEWQAGELLYRVLSDPDRQVRRYAEGISEVDQLREWVLSRAEREMASPHEWLQQGAGRVVDQMPGKYAGSFLLRLLRDPSPVVRVEAARLLQPYLRAEIVSALILALDDPDERVRLAVVKYWNVSRVDGGVLVGLLRGFLTDPDPIMVSTCAWVLGRIGQEAAPALPDIAACLPHLDSHGWSRAVEAMMRIDPEGSSSRKFLLAGLGDPDPAFSQAAFYLLMVSNPQPGLIPGLAELLCSPNATVSQRDGAFYELSRFGSPSPETLTAFRTCLEVDSPPGTMWGAFRNLSASAAPLLPTLVARARRPNAPDVGGPIAWTGPEGVASLATLFDECLTEPRMIPPLVRGLHNFGPAIISLVSRLEALLLIAPDLETGMEIEKAILAATGNTVTGTRSA